jgi:hypothetical protein
MGEPKFGSTVPPFQLVQSARSPPVSPIAHEFHPTRKCLRGGLLLTKSRAALCAARVAARAVVAIAIGVKWGVSDPLFAAPDFAPGAARTGSLTPQIHVTVVRKNRAL